VPRPRLGGRDAGLVPVKHNRFIALPGGTAPVNREFEAKTRALAGLKGYITDLRTMPRTDPGHARVRDRVLAPPALPYREELPDGRKRSAGPAGLPPDLRLDRGPSDHRARRLGRRFVRIAGIAPSRSRVATTSSPSPTRYPMTSVTPSTQSAAPREARTSLAEVRRSGCRVGDWRGGIVRRQVPQPPFPGFPLRAASLR
jgi:hypothetical protein